MRIVPPKVLLKPDFVAVFWIHVTVAVKLQYCSSEHLLGTFAKFRKATVSFVMSIWSPSDRSSVRPPGTNCLPLDGFWWNLIFELFRYSFEKIQVSLKSDKKNRYFTSRHVHIYDNISQNSSWNEKYFRQNLWKKPKHILCSIIFFGKLCRLWDNLEKYGRARKATGDNIIQRMCIASG